MKEVEKRTGIDREKFILFCSELTITAKEGKGGSSIVPMELLPTQVYLLDEILEGLSRGVHYFVVLKCLDPSTRVLTGDLRWVPLGIVKEGDKLVGFDEEAPVEKKKRRLRETEVKRVWRKVDQAIGIEFEDGGKLIAGSSHRHLIKQPGGVESVWRRTDRLKPGDKIRSVVRPWEESSFEDGWAGGLIDGEGSLHSRLDQGARLSVYQRSGEVMERYRRYLAQRGIDFYCATDKRKGESGSLGKQGSAEIELTAVGNLAGALKLIGMSRPSRFVNEAWWADKALGRSGNSWRTVKRLVFLDRRELVDIETTTGTFIAEGCCTHNCRQSGTTTLGLAFELWWCFSHEGFILNFIADGNKRLAFNRAMLVEMAESLREKPEWGCPVRDDNKEMLSFANRSKVIWNNANARDEGGLGRGVGVMGFHATEIARYKDEDAWNAMQDGLAKKNPHRFYLVEGTSEGPNLFKDVWDEACSESNVSQKAIFIGWWLHPDYRADRSEETGKRIYEVYWEAVPRLSREESEWVEGVRKRYGYQVTPEQIAWWRFELKESKRGNLQMLYQEYPPLPEYAWAYGGKSYVSATSITVQKLNVRKNVSRNRYFQVEFGASFHETRLLEVKEDASWYDLVVFEEPRVGPNLRYAIGVDPAHGASEASDAAAISVWAAYADGMVQVAEYNAVEEPSYHLAWVLLLLAGAYNSQTLVNLELQGGGYSVQDHIRHLQEQLAAGYDDKLSAYFSDLRFYTYSRPDAVTKAYASFNWITSQRTREMMLSYWRDLFEQGIVEVRSPELVLQTQKVKRLRDGTIETPETDHRLMAAAIASMAFKQLLETDIGGVEACQRANVERWVPNREGTQVATPGAVLEDRILGWRNNLLRDNAEEKANLEIPDWVEELKERARNSPWQ